MHCQAIDRINKRIKVKTVSSPMILMEIEIQSNFNCFSRTLLSFDNNSVILVRLNRPMERKNVENIGILYDLLADAIDEINEIFSMEVKINFLKNSKNFKVFCSS